MTWRQDVAEGWRIATPALAAVFTPRRLRILWPTSVVLGIGGAAALRVVIGASMPEAQATLASLSAGTGAAAILWSVLGFVWRRPAVLSGRVVRGGVLLDQRDEREIASAWREGRAPDVSVAKRLAAAERSRRLVRSVPPSLVTTLPLASLLVPYLLAAAAAYPHVGAFAGVFGFLMTVVTPLSTLAALGRTTAAIETAPEVPEHFEADGRPKRKPLKLLGTDHPDDFT